MRRAGTAGRWWRLLLVAFTVLATMAEAAPAPVAADPLWVSPFDDLQWGRLPRAPFPLAGDASPVWTGRDLVVWGGAVEGADPSARGGRYDPDRRTWRAVADAPIGSRAGAVVAWTGDEVLVWGGRRRPTSTVQASDGAAYDPVRDSWRRLTRRGAPPGGALVQSGTWTGSELVVVSAAPGAGPSGTVVRADAYDPVHDRWRSLGSHRSAREPTRALDADVVVRGARIDVWVTWAARMVPTRSASGREGRSARGGLQERFRPAADGWRLVATSPDGRGVSDPMAAGDTVVALGERGFCTQCSGPLVVDRPTVVLGTPGGGHAGPARDRWRPIGHDGPMAGSHPVLLMAEGFILRYNPTDSVGGPDPRIGVHPGDLAAMRLGQDQWHELPRSPRTGFGAQLVWAGDRLLMWGDLGPSCTGFEDICPGGVAIAGGMELAPPS